MNLQINMAVCRVCMKRQDEPGVSVFANSALLKKFILMTDLEISQNDNLPSDICHRCVTRLNVAFEFRKQARASDTHFRKFIEKVNQQFSQLAVSPSHTEKGADDDFDPDVEYLIEAEEVEPETATVIPVQSFTVSSPEPSEETKRDLERPQKRAKMEVIDNIDIVELEYQGTEEVVSDFADNEQSVVVERSKAEEPHIVKVPAEKRAVKRETVSENVCGKCNKSFSTRTNLIRHLSSHDGNRPYVCSTCGKGFTQNGSLKQHMFLHTGERPFKCSVCDRSFTQAKTLTFHMRRHTGEKPFTCSHCNANFRQRDGLKRHILVKHNMILKEIHECEICRKELPSRTALLMHSKRHTDNEDPITTVTKTADDGSIFYTVVEVPEEK